MNQGQHPHYIMRALPFSEEVVSERAKEERSIRWKYLRFEDGHFKTTLKYDGTQLFSFFRTPIDVHNRYWVCNERFGTSSRDTWYLEGNPNHVLLMFQIA